MHIALIVLLFLFAALFLVGTFGTIAAVGRPRKATTPADVVRSTAVGFTLTAVLIWAALTITTTA